MVTPTFRLAALLLILVASSGVDAQHAERADEDALSRRAAERLRTLHDEADRLASEEKSVLGDLRKLEVERQIRAEELQETESEARTLADQLSALDQQIEHLDAQARRETPVLRARLVGLYKLGTGGYARLLLSTTDVRQFGRATRLVAALAAQDHQRVVSYQRGVTELNDSRRGMTERQAQLAELQRRAERARAEVDRVLAERNALIREIDQRRDLNAQLTSELLSAQQRLQSAVAGLSNGATPSLPIEPFRGDLDWPVADGTIRQRFGLSDIRRGVSNGVDIAANEGLPVRAVHGGTVAFADSFTGFGRLVILDHGGQNFSLYGNLKDISVAKGDRVQGGATLGSVGVAATGATGVYFELRIDGRAVDPLQWLRPGSKPR